MLTISAHGIAGCCFQVSLETLAAASPTISTSRTSSNCRSLSLEISSFFPFDQLDGFTSMIEHMTKAHVIVMLGHDISTSSRKILHPSFFEHALAKIGAECLCSVEIDFAASEETAQVDFHPAQAN